MTQVSAKEIQDAGGFDKWVAKAKNTRPCPKPSVVNASSANSALGSSPSARGRKPSNLQLGYDAERMNGLEARYAGFLEGQCQTGELIFWKFEEIKLRLADGTFYTPDFFVMQPDGSVGFHETKGFWRDDARVKIKAAAERYPMFFFVAVQWASKAKEWKFEYFRDKR